MGRSSLRRELVIPIAVLVIGISVATAWVSMKTGVDAVNTLSERVLVDLADRIGNETERQLEGSMVVLESIAPSTKNIPRLQPFSNDLDQLESKLWAASGLFMTVNNFVYFGGVDGRMIGVFRRSPDFVELYRQEPGSPTRKTFRSLAPGDRSMMLREDQFDVHTRPWFLSALQSDQAVWSGIYNDYTSREPTISLSKTVFDREHKVVGVVATDVALKSLSDFLKTIQLSPNGVAYIVDDDGYIVASSGSEPIVRNVDGKTMRLHATEMRTQLISDVYQKKLQWEKDSGRKNLSGRTHEIESGSSTVEVAASMINGGPGLHWTTIVAIPRADFMKDIDAAFFQSALIAAAFIILALIVGLVILDRVMRDIVKLTVAAKRFGDGEPVRDLNIRRGDEIGILAQTFLEMENKLRFDKLTQVANRESLFAQLGQLQKFAKKNPQTFTGFTLLFVDLDRFKIINDNFGHDTGDQVLVIIASRLQAAVRDTDMVARYGGDEFVLLLRETNSLAAIHQIIEKICSLIEQPIVVNGTLLNVGLSVGWACCPEDGDDYLSLIKIADSRMYVRKRDRKSSQLHLV